MKISSRTIQGLIVLASTVASFAASASTISCTGQNISFDLQLEGTRAVAVSSIKTQDVEVKSSLLESNKSEIIGPTASNDKDYPTFFEGYFQSPSPQGLAKWNLMINDKAQQGQLIWDNDDGGMKTFQLSCTTK